MNGLKVSSEIHRSPSLPSTVTLDASYSSDDADFDGTPGLGGASQWKEPVRAATTTSITIATALNNGDTLDGVTLATGDRVLVKDQGTHSENGIYVVDTTPYRAGDMDDDSEVLGAVVYVIDGSTNGGTAWVVSNTTATVVDTDDIDWAAFGGGGGGTPASTVTDETTWGISPSVGTDTEYARQDHTHGTPADPGSGGGGSSPGSAAVYPVQEKNFNNANSNAASFTMGATPTNGNILLLISSGEGSANISSVTQTNVTWSKLAETAASTAPHVEIWKGVVGASAGTGITVAYSASMWHSAIVVEYAGITGTLDQSATNAAVTYAPLITPTSDSALCITAMAQTSNTATCQRVHGNWVRYKASWLMGTGGIGAAFSFPGKNKNPGYFDFSSPATEAGLTVSIT